MATYSLVPNGYDGAWSNINFTYAGGSTSVWDALDDTSTGTYATATGGSGLVRMTMTTQTIPAGYAVEKLRCQIQQGRSSTASLVTIAPGVTGLPSTTFPDTQLTGRDMKHTASFIDLDWYLTSGATDGAANFTQAMVDSLTYLITDSTGVASCTFYNAKMEVVTTSIPTVSTVAGQANQPNPVISWTYADTDGLPQYKAKVRIFTAAQYGAAGFNPKTSTATWETTTYGVTEQVTCGVALTNGVTYRAYVWVYKQGTSGNTTEFESASANGSWTTSLVVPPVPTLSVAWNGSKYGYDITVRSNHNMLDNVIADCNSASTTYFTITNGTGGTTATSPQYGTSAVTLTSSSTSTITVESAPAYRVRVKEGEYYSAQAWFKRVTAAADRTCTMAIRWYDSAGTLLSTSSGTGSVVGTTWTQRVLNGTVAPAGAYYAAPYLSVATTVASEVYHIDGIGIHPSTSSTAPPSWSNGSLGNAYVKVRNTTLTGSPESWPTNASVTDGDYTWTWTDYYFKPGVSNTYEAQTLGVNGLNSSTTTGSGSATGSQWWWRAPMSESLNTQVPVMPGMAYAYDEDVAVFQPLGRTRAVALSGTLYGLGSIQWTMVTADATVWAKIQALMEYQYPTILQTGNNEVYWVRLTNRNFTVSNTQSKPVWTAQLEFVQVDVP